MTGGADAQGAINRRGVLAGLAGAALATATRPACAADSLGEVAARAGIRFGSALGGEGLSDPAYRELVLAQSRILTTDPGFIMPFVRPERGRVDFSATDALASLSAERGLPLRGHCLIWNDVTPPWLGRLSRAEVGAMLDTHVDETVSRYRGRIHSWDVVNEPFHPFQREPGGWRRGPWLSALGPHYIARALRRASLADPAARLVINEAWTEPETDASGAVRTNLLRLVDDLQGAGVPLHAIGLQAHLSAHERFEPVAFEAFLRALERRRLDIYITELDVNDLELEPDAAARDARVAATYAAFMETVLKVAAVKVVITWQLADRWSWLTRPFFVGQFPPRRRRFAARPLPFDAALAPKPAHAALVSAFRKRAL